MAINTCAGTRFGLGLIAFVFSMVLTAQAQAQIIFAPSFTYNSAKSTDNTGFLGNSDTKVIVLDARLGTLMSQNFYLGGLYRYEDTSFGGGSKVSGSALAPSVGYVNGAFSLIFSYYLLAERKYSNGGVENKISSGTGPQLDIAWAPQVASNFGLGPQLTYRSVKYTKAKAGAGSETSDSYEETTIDPMIALWFQF